MKGTPAAWAATPSTQESPTTKAWGAPLPLDRGQGGRPLGDDPPAVGIRLHLAHVVAGDGDVEQRVEPEAREGLERDVPRVVRPEGRLEAGLASPAHGLDRPRLERGRAERPPLVVEGDRPQTRLQCSGVSRWHSAISSPTR